MKVEPKQITSIGIVNISDYPYEILDKICFFSSFNNTGFYDLTKSVPFFSKGVEGLLQFWDVRLKWRLNRLFNPMYYGSTRDEIDNNKKRYLNGYISETEKKEFYDWVNKYTSKRYLEDTKLLKKLFDTEYYEMINSNCFALNLREGIDYDVHQIDPKKKNNRHPVLGLDDIAKAQYGSYSDLDSDYADKWDLHTKGEVKLNPTQIKKISTNEDGNILSVIQVMYTKYKENVKEEDQSKFDLLDVFIEYIKNKDKTLGDDVDEGNKKKIFQLTDKGFSNILLITLIAGFASGIISALTFIMLHRL